MAAGVVALIGAMPLPPTRITIATIEALRAPDGSSPCSEGLAAARKWLGTRSLPYEHAIREAQADPGVSQYVQWALAAMGSGYGYGYGHGSGDGYGYGYGYGYGHSYSDGDGSGDG